MRLINRLKYHLILGALAAIPSVTSATDSCEPFDDGHDVFLEAVRRQTQLLQTSIQRRQLVDDIISYAGSFIGTPYRRGAKGPKRFDCSGFTRYIFRHFDKHLASSSRAQYLQGSPVDSQDIRPGDLLFFSGRRVGKTIGHVAIAISVDSRGDISFIHAATSGGIRIDRLHDGGYYERRFIGARRVI